MKTPWRALYDAGTSADDAVHGLGRVGGGIIALGLLILWALAGWLFKSLSPNGGLSKWYESNSLTVLFVLVAVFSVYALGLSVWQGITEKPDSEGDA